MQQFSVEQVVPHSGKMSLLDSIDAYGEDWLEASATIHPENLFLQNGGVPSWVGIEYMAQTVAAYGGTVARLASDDVQIGFLLGTRRYEIDTPSFDLGTRLFMRVQHLMSSESGLGAFECSIHGTQRGRAFSSTANLNIYQPKNIDEILEGQP